MTWQWASANLIDGRVIADLPSLDPAWPLRKTISQDDTATVTLHLDGAPENWEQAVREGGALIFAYEDSDPTYPIVWCGYVLQAPRDAASDDIDISLATFEAVLDRAYVGDTTYTTSDHRDDIIADLIDSWFGPATGITYLETDYTPGGGPVPVLMDSPPASIPDAAIIMQRTDAATVKARIDQVIGQLGGQYTVTWAWSADRQSIIPTMRWGDRIGAAAVDGIPAVTFEMPGVLTAFVEGRSYQSGDGANQVVTFSSGQGATTPFSDPVNVPDDGRPTLAYWYQPAASISKAALDQYAAQALTVLAPGKRPVTLTYSTERDTGRKLGTDWNIGDDIGFRIPAQYTNETGALVTVRAFPGGREGLGQAIAYELTDPTTVTPILADAVIYQGA